MKSRKDIEKSIALATDEASFVRHVLVDCLQWPIAPGATVQDIAYDWDPQEAGAPKLDPAVAGGVIRQVVLPGCPWGIFILDFKRPDLFTTGRGLTGPLRDLLRGLVSHGRRDPKLPSFQREHLLFICTHAYRYFRFAQFRVPADGFKRPPLASFGWGPGDSVKTVAEYNLPHLDFRDPGATVDDWVGACSAAFDVERVTKRFYADYQALHDRFKHAARHVASAADRPWLASVLLNRLMFVYFLQKKGFVDRGNRAYLEEKLAASRKLGKDRFYKDFLSLLFFEGFAKPEDKRSPAARAVLGSIRYLNGGLFLEHPIEQAARAAGTPVDWPDDAFAAAFHFFASFSWNLNDVPGGEDNEINPDVLGYILEKYVNQKAFGAYYTRPEITGYLCERTIHRLVLDAVNTPPGQLALAAKAGLPVRQFSAVAQLFKKLDDPLAARLLDQVLPGLALLDPACGSGAFLVAAMKTLISLYAAVFSWIEFHGSAPLKARLARIRAEHPSLDYFIKKRIITDNLFGVDLMPEAVEIARLRLFLALVASADKPEHLEPLPNIDFNVVAGNSLIGLLDVKPALFDQGKLFEQTYEQIVADRDRQLETYRHTAAYAEDLTALRDNITAVNDKAQKQLNDLLLDQFHDLGIKFEQATWDDAKGEAGKPVKRKLAPADIDRLRPFHWAFAFAKVMQRGGFDAMERLDRLKNGDKYFGAADQQVLEDKKRIQDFNATAAGIRSAMQTVVDVAGSLNPISNTVTAVTGQNASGSDAGSVGRVGAGLAAGLPLLGGVGALVDAATAGKLSEAIAPVLDSIRGLWPLGNGTASIAENAAGGASTLANFSGKVEQATDGVLGGFVKADGTVDFVPFTRDGLTGHTAAQAAGVIPADAAGGFSVSVQNGKIAGYNFNSALNGDAVTLSPALQQQIKASLSTVAATKH